jgi:hypothetical protein
MLKNPRYRVHLEIDVEQATLVNKILEKIPNMKIKDIFLEGIKSIKENSGI